MQWDQWSHLWNTEDGLLCLFSFHYELWINIFGKSSHSAKIFKIQKNIIRIITGCRNRNSCRDLLKNLKIPSLQSQYILSLLLFVVNNKNKLKLNSYVHHINTRQKCNFHQPSSNLSLYQKEVYSIGIKIFNSLHKVSKIEVIILNNLNQP